MNELLAGDPTMTGALLAIAAVCLALFIVLYRGGRPRLEKRDDEETEEGER